METTENEHRKFEHVGLDQRTCNYSTPSPTSAWTSAQNQAPRSTQPEPYFRE